MAIAETRHSADMSTATTDRATRKPWDCAGKLVIESNFCPPHVDDPFDTVEWERRTAAIKDENGEVLFEQTDAEIPAGWSQLATNVVVSKYFYGEVDTPERETSVRVVDFQSTPHIDPEQFFDVTHLSPLTGARVFSAHLADHYAQVLAPPGLP